MPEQSFTTSKFCNLKKTELSHFIKVEAIKFLSLTGGKWEPVISLLAAARNHQQWKMSETVSKFLMSHAMEIWLFGEVRMTLTYYIIY